MHLSIAQQGLLGCYHTTYPGRPPRNPISMLQAFIIMRVKSIRSLGELTRILDVDRCIRRLSLIRDCEKCYTRSVLSRFTVESGLRGSACVGLGNNKTPS